jgi:hypothetical protein
MLWHDYEGVQFVAVFAAVPMKRLQEKAHVIFDYEQFSAAVRRERHEISSGRGDESSRFQEQTSAAESRTSVSTLNWHEWNSCPSRLFLLRRVSFQERKYDAAK